MLDLDTFSPSPVTKPKPVSEPTMDGEPRRLARRGVFTSGSAAILAAMWSAATAPRKAAAIPPHAVAVDADPSALISKLVRRITLGANTAELTVANQLGYLEYLERQLNHTQIDDSAVDARVNALLTINMTPLQMYGQTAGQLRNDVTEATIVRSVFSNRQLFQRMVEFWTDHFNIDINKEPTNMLKSTDDRDVIRANALGTFPALLSASAHSPAMLTYLDNQTSTALAPNENYAREIMELHTLGVDGGYSQQDVLEVAKCFSGWSYVTYRSASPDPLSGQFRFDATRHTGGTKTVLGQSITAGGINDGLAVLNILANHPNAARYISTKLAAWFLGDNTPQGVIDSVVATYTATGGDIKSMLRTLLSPNVLATAPAKYKRPYHLTVSAMRAVPAAISATNAVAGVRNSLNTMGHLPFYWSTPDGYPDLLEYWAGLIVPRWNMGFQLMNNSISGVTVDTAGFLAGLTTAQQIVDKIDVALFGGEMPAYDKTRIRTYLSSTPTNLTTQRDAIGLALGSPGFQWY